MAAATSSGPKIANHDDFFFPLPIVALSITPHVTSLLMTIVWTEIRQRRNLPSVTFEIFCLRCLEGITFRFNVDHNPGLVVGSHKDIEDLFYGPKSDRLDDYGRW